MADYQPQAFAQQPAVYGAPQTVTGQPQFVRPIVLGNSTYQQQQVTNQNLGQSGFYQGGGLLVNQPVMGASAISSNIVSTGQAVKGESRIEYIPYEKTIMEYEEVRRQVQVPITRQITEYQAIQYETEYIPQVIQEKVIEYMAVEKVAERVEYQTVTRQNVLQNTVQQVQQTQIQPIVTSQTYQTYQATTPIVQTVQQPIVTQMTQPVVQQQLIQNVPQTYYQTYQQPITTQYIQQPLPVQQIIPAPVYQNSSPRIRQSSQFIKASAPITTTTAYAQPPVLYQASQTRVGAPIVQTQPVVYGYQPQGQQLLTYQGQVAQPNLPNQPKQPNQPSTQTPKVSQPPQQPQTNQVPSNLQQQQQPQQQKPQQQQSQQQQPITNQQQQKQDKGFLAKLFD